MYTLGFLTLVFAVAAAWFHAFQNRRHLQVWQCAMAPCNMSEVKSSSVWALWRRLTARSGSIEVRIKPSGKHRPPRVIVVVKGPEGFSIVKLSRKHFNLWAREIEVGDEAFEDNYLIEGPVAPVCALLDATVRDHFNRADYETLAIGDGKLRAEMSERALPRILPLLVYVGRRFAEPLDVKRRIAENARQDPQAKVRLTNLLVLAGEHPGDPDTLEALRIACSDASPEVRVRAAIELGEEGRDVLLNLAESSDDDASSPDARETPGVQPV